MRESNNPIQIALASRSQFFLQGIKRILQDEGDIKIVAEVIDSKEVKKCIKEIKPDFIFIDNRTPEFSIQDQLNSLINKNCTTRFILFDTYRGEKHFSRNIVYISREAGSKELIESVRKNSRSNEGAQDRKDYSGHDKNRLTNREADIVNLIKIGMSNKRIAQRLSIREKTVKANLTNIFTKLQVQSRYQLLVRARQQGPNNSSEHEFSKTG
ncbi:MAG TPA: response regulator transcription factor [Thermodesulfobacteriota bacterium]|nr:response regulator transcription factor [Thermodesulfobacteriota bacterium]